MPWPIAEECEDSIDAAYTAKSAIVAAINKVNGLANDQTWSGQPADAWVSELNGYVKAALNSLDEPLSSAVAAARATAQKLLKQQAANAAGTVGH